MIVAQRAYEANSKVVQAADEMYQQVNNLTR
jgi:flagellar basal-body rod protein FlgG